MHPAEIITHQAGKTSVNCHRAADISEEHINSIETRVDISELTINIVE